MDNYALHNVGFDISLVLFALLAARVVPELRWDAVRKVKSWLDRPRNTKE